MTAADALLVLNALSTWGMVGVILFVQRVHYPLFDRYRRHDFPATERFHEARTAGVVAPLMLTELLTSVALVAKTPPGVAAWQAWLGAGLAGVWGASTALVQVPLHRRLEAGFDAGAHRRLLQTNRVRVAAWLLRGGLAAAMLAGRLGA